MKYVHIAAVIFTIAGVSETRGQSAAAFEVVSIKPSNPSALGMRVGIAPGGVFRANNVTLQRLINQAYDVRDFQVSGGPSWMNTQRYDIVAKGGGPGISEEDLIKMTNEQRNDFQKQMQGKLQALMADRFQLKLHRETKELPVYPLIVAKNGSKIHAVTDNLTPRTGLNMKRNAPARVGAPGVIAAS